ncbi:MAG: hypothetical protein ABIV50_11985 [Opitutus sp.]
MPSLPVSHSAATGRATRKSTWIVFGLLFTIGMVWATYTQHVWEDFYITYRASKNLATGNGFTFTVGERVHSYTSPIGGLLPALASLLTGNSSDRVALWLFRLMSTAAYAGAGAFLWRLARRMYVGLLPAVFLVAMVATDAKMIDFSTNGMEAPFVLLFLTWTFYALFVVPPRATLHLGLAWGGLMWSRPDSFIYIGALALGTLLFSRARPFLATRVSMLKQFFAAGGITALLYAPWLIWAWSYYGSPIPHTIVAKGLFKPVMTFGGFVKAIGDFPFKIVRDGASLATTFMPPYGVTTGWHPWAVKTSFGLALIALVLWIVPKVRWEVRVVSFAFTIGHFYLNYLAGFHSPWYLPTLTLLAFMAITTVLSQLDVVSASRVQLDRIGRTGWRRALIGVATLLPVSALVLTGFAAFEMKCSQSLSEDGNRRVLGQWLKANAATPHDTVFLEPLGYIGFFSGLKMYDYPGLCSPEVVAVRRKIPRIGNYTEHWPELIAYLAPDWVVMRDSEIEVVSRNAPELLTKYYQRQRVFDVRDKIKAMPFLPGRGYLDFDAHFEVFRRNAEISRSDFPIHAPITVPSLIEKQSWTGPAYFSEGHIAAHAPSLISTEVPTSARKIIGSFGFFPGSYEKPQDSTEGADFTVTLVAKDGSKREIFTTRLNPKENPDHRGDQWFSVEVPASEGSTVEFTTNPLPGKSNAYGWTYWKGLNFVLTRS